MRYKTCPECGHAPVVTKPVAIGRNEYSETTAETFAEFKGVADACPLKNDETACVALRIDQDAYKTKNHFKNRYEYQRMSHVTVSDVYHDEDEYRKHGDRNDVHDPELDVDVLITFDGSSFTHTAWNCPECDHTWDDTLGDLNDNPVVDPRDQERGNSDSMNEAEIGAMEELYSELSSLDLESKIPVDVAPGRGSYAAKDGSIVQVDPQTAKEIDPLMGSLDRFRVTTDIFYHEAEHVRSSDLESKERITEAYPVCPQAAGFVANVLEDQWVDHERIRRKPGMKKNRAFYMKKLAENDEMHPPVHELETQGQYLSALLQKALFGYVKGIDHPETADLLPEFIDEVESEIEIVRSTRSQDDREHIFHGVIQTMIDYLEDEFDPDEKRVDDGEGDSEDGDGEESPGRDSTRMTKEETRDLDKAARELINEHDEVTGDTISSHDERDIRSDADFSDGDDERSDDDESEAESGDDERSSGDVEGHGEPSGDDDEREGEDTKGGTIRPSGRINGEDDSIHDPDEIIKDVFNVDADEDLETPDARDEKMFERYKKKRNKFDQPIEKKRRQREKKILKNRNMKKGTPEEVLLSDSLREECREQVQAVIDEFKEMMSRETPTPERSGERVHRRNAVRRAAGDRSEERLFTTPETNDTGKRCVAVAADISGSMGSDIDCLKKTIGTLGEATEEVDDTFVATGITDNPEYHGLASRQGPDTVTEKALDLRLITAPTETFNWKQLDSFGACMNEPMAAGVRWTMELIDEVSSTEDVMFVITDGNALITEDGRKKPSEAKRDFKNAINDVRDDDVEVIGIGFGGAKRHYMRQCFGEGNFVMTTPSNLAEDVIGLYRSIVDD